MGTAAKRVVIALAMMAGGCAQMPDRDLTPLPQPVGLADQPAGFVSFCMRFPGQCDAAPGKTNTVSLDRQNWDLLGKINNDVNRAIWPEDDLRHYGRAEYWTIPTDGLGDCEDYALTKRKQLAEAGVPISALRLAVVFTANGERHAVLTVATDKGDLVLDNLTDDILAWNKTRFTWVERQDAADPMKWVSLAPAYVARNNQPPAAAAKDTAAIALAAAPTGGTN